MLKILQIKKKLQISSSIGKGVGRKISKGEGNRKTKVEKYDASGGVE